MKEAVEGKEAADDNKESHQELSEDIIIQSNDDRKSKGQSSSRSSKKRTNNELEDDDDDEGAECDCRNQDDQHDRSEDSSQLGQQQEPHGKKHKADGKRLREIKRQKFEAKQQRLRTKMLQQSSTQSTIDEDTGSEDHKPVGGTTAWFHYQQQKYPNVFIHKVTNDDVEQILHLRRRPTTTDPSSSQQKQDQKIERRLQEILSPYINMKDVGQDGSVSGKYCGHDNCHRQDKTEEGERLFIAEGTETIRILIQQQKFHSSSCSVMKHNKRHEITTDNNNNNNNNSMDSEEMFREGVSDIVPKLKSIFVKPSVMFDEPVKLVSDIDQIVNLNLSTSKENDDVETVIVTKHTESSDQEKIIPFHVLVGEDSSVLSLVAGFKIGRGALACGVVPQGLTEEWLDNFLNSRTTTTKKKGIRLLALDGVCDTANLGSMIRTASALGVDAIVLSADCCDEWYRRSVRVSMGHIFLVPVVRVTNLAAFLNKWSVKQADDNTTRYEERLLIHSYAAVVAETSSSGNARETLVLEQLQHGYVSSSWCCVLGNEGNGISDEVADSCTDTIRIGMKDGVDSLSVVVACGILIHGLLEREEK